METKSTKVLSDERAKNINSLKFCKDNSIIAVKTSWCNDGSTFCEIYSRKTKKKFPINTNKLFNNVDFMNNQNDFMEKLIVKKDII